MTLWFWNKILKLFCEKSYNFLIPSFSVFSTVHTLYFFTMSITHFPQIHQIWMNSVYNFALCKWNQANDGCGTLKGSIKIFLFSGIFFNSVTRGQKLKRDAYLSLDKSKIKKIHKNFLFQSILSHLSWKLIWTFLIAGLPASILLSVSFSRFYLLRNHRIHLTNLCTTYPLVTGIKFVQVKGHDLFKGR